MYKTVVVSGVVTVSGVVRNSGWVWTRWGREGRITAVGTNGYYECVLVLSSGLRFLS